MDTILSTITRYIKLIEKIGNFSSYVLTIKFYIYNLVKMNRIIRIYIMAMMLMASAVIIVGTNDSSGAPLNGYNLPSTAWSGQVTILPDGSLSNTGAPIEITGNLYALTGNINGTLTVELPGAIVNGNGYTVWNTVNVPPVKLQNANGITLENMTVVSWYATAINIVSSSCDLVTDNNVIAMVNGIYVFSPFNTITSNNVNISLQVPSYSGLSSGITVKASSTEVSGNTVTMGQSGYGIFLQAGMSDVNGNSISLSGSYSQGLVVAGASNNVEENIIHGTGSDLIGINLQLGSQFTNVSANNVYLTGQRSVGTSLQDGFNSIENNALYVQGSYAYGFEVMSSGTGSNQIFKNIVNSTGQYSVGIYDNSQGSVISMNTVMVNGSYGRGISAFNSVNISDNEIEIIGDNTYGISSPNGYVTNNAIKSNGSYVYGIYSSGGQYTAIEGNTLNASGSHAIGVLLSGSFQTLSENMITAGYKSGTGLMINSLTNSRISNNSIIYSQTGISSTYYTSYVLTFQGNYLLNDTVAFDIVGVTSNLFYHNSFINYTSYEITGSGNATWDYGYPTGGNYWNTYTGLDLFSGVAQNVTGSDGIGDVQFNVTSNNIDHYPLMAPWLRPTITFVESGLAKGKAWSIDLSGSVKTSDSSSMTFYVTSPAFSNYSYNIGDVKGYTHSKASGTVEYNGSSIIEQVVYQAIPESTYNVVFTQNGLPAGTQWSVTFGETTMTSTASSITFDPVNGTYSYEISSVPGYYSSQDDGTVVVDGQNNAVTVAFTQVVYSVVFNTQGLPSGMNWYVNLSNGKSFTSTGSTLQFSLPNGTYSYTVDKVSEYNSTPSTGQFTVTGNSPDPILISFAHNSTVPPVIPTSNNPGIWPYILGGIIGAAIAAVAAVTVLYVRKR